MFGFQRVNTLSETSSSQGEDCEALIPEQEKSEPSLSKPRSKIPLLHVIVLLITFPLSSLLGAYFGGGVFWKEERTRSCVAKVSKYSPLLEDVKIGFSEVHFNGSLFHKNKFREDAGPEVDAAWQSLGVDYRAAIVPEHLAAKSGLLPSQVQVNQKYGGGYPANVEGLHHLHCLNLLRQSLYYNFDYYHAQKQGAFKNEDHILKAHVSHCLDMLRQQLQCTVDIGVLGQVWWKPEAPQAYPDFNTKHTCRNFEDVRKWAEERQAPEKVPDDFLARPRWGDVYETIP